MACLENCGRRERKRVCRRYRLTGRTPPVRVTENRARPHRIVPSLGQGSPHRSVLVVRVPLSDKRPPLQGVPGMEVVAKGDVGGGAEGDGKVEEPVEDPGPACRQEVRTGSAGLPHRNRCGKAGATCGRGRRREPDVRMGAPGAPGARRGTGGGGGGAGFCGRSGRWGGIAAVLAHTLLHGIGRRGVGEGRFSFVTFLCGLFGAHLFSGQAWRRAKGSLQRAATVRTADRKTGQNVRRHDLYRSNASMNKQKKTVFGSATVGLLAASSNRILLKRSRNSVNT